METQGRTPPQVVCVVNDAPGEPATVVESRYQNGHDERELPHQANVHTINNAGVSTNPVTRLYDQALNAGAGRWLCAVIVLGLAAGIISKHPGKLLLAASAFNLALACLHVPLFGPMTKPVSPKNARPPNWYIIILLLSTLSWIAAMSFMFALFSHKRQYVIVDLHKRGLGTLVGLGTGVLSLLENITIACGCIGASAFICCLFQWVVVLRLMHGDFKEKDIAEAFASNDQTRNVNNDS